MSIENVVYVFFDELHKETFFQIPISLETLKEYIINFCPILENKILLLEDENHKKINNNDDFIKLKDKKKIIIHVKVMEDINDFLLLESSMKINKNSINILDSENEKMSMILKKNQKIKYIEIINDLTTKLDKLTNEIQNLNDKYNKLEKEIENLKKKNNDNYDVINKNKEETKRKNKKEENLQKMSIQISSIPQQINLDSLINNQAKFNIKIKNLNNFSLGKGFIFNIPKGENTLFFSNDIDLFKDQNLEVNEERELFVDLIFNKNIKQIQKEIIFPFTIKKKDIIIEENYGQVIILNKKK